MSALPHTRAVGAHARHPRRPARLAATAGAPVRAVRARGNGGRGGGAATRPRAAARARRRRRLTAAAARGRGVGADGLAAAPASGTPTVETQVDRHGHKSNSEVSNALPTGHHISVSHAECARTSASAFCVHLKKLCTVVLCVCVSDTTSTRVCAAHCSISTATNCQPPSSKRSVTSAVEHTLTAATIHHCCIRIGSTH